MRISNFFLIILFILVGFSKLNGQDISNEQVSIVEILENTPGVKITQPEALSRRLVKAVPDVAGDEGHDNTSRTPAKSAMYRVEVFADNTKDAKNRATTRRRNIQARLPQYNSQLVFDSPFWRVKVGPFSSRSDAEAAMAEIRAAFPAYAPYLRIVRN